MKWFCLATICLMMLLSAPQSQANLPGGHDRYGWVYEASLTPADFIVNLTGKNGKVLAVPGWPKRLTGKKTGGLWTAKTYVPFMENVYDAVNETVPKVPPKGPGNPGGKPVAPRSILRLESLKIDPVEGLQSDYIFDTIKNKVGSDVPVTIPDLYSCDINGVLQDETTLYSLVDLNVYLDHIPTFTLGQTFSIVNGKVAGLDGMVFSSTPIDFSGNDLSYTPYNGFGNALTLHELGSTDVPEGSAWVTMGVLSTGLMLIYRRRSN